MNGHKANNKTMREMSRRVDKLRRVVEGDHNNHSSGDTIAVDYFALKDLIEYFDETKDAAKQVIIAREALDGVYFSSDK